MDEDLRGVHLSAHVEHPGSLLANEEVVASDHLDLNALNVALCDGGGSVVTGGVKEGEEAKHLPVSLAVLAVTLCNGDSERPESTVGELDHLVVDSIGDLFHLAVPLEDNLRGALEDPDRGAVRAEDSGAGELVDGVEGDELGGLVGLELLLVLVGMVEDHINRLLSHNVGGEGAVLENGLNGGALADRVDRVVLNGELVLCERASLIRAEDVHASHLLDGRHTGDNGSLLGELEGSKGEGDGKDGGHGNGDSSNNDNEHVSEGGAGL